MIEVHPGLWVGDETDERATRGEPGWFVVHACKEPFHRRALGYEGRAAPKDDPEYLVAHRPGCIILNLVDAPDPDMIPAECIAAAIIAIAEHAPEAKILIHCNRGESRAPSIALMYLAINTELFDDCSYPEAAVRFAITYPTFQPAKGMEFFARRVWEGDVCLPDPRGVAPPPIREPPPMAMQAAPRTRGRIFTL